MAGGSYTLRNSNEDGMQQFNEYCKKMWLKVSTNSQLAEQWVIDSNKCTYTSKDKKLSNILAIERSWTVMFFNGKAYKEHKDCIRKVTKNFNAGKL